MWQAALALLAPDLDCQAPCSAEPHSARENNFVLSVLVHGVALGDAFGFEGRRGFADAQGPSLVLSARGAAQTTARGHWSMDEGQWKFHEVMSLQVCVEDEITLSIFGGCGDVLASTGSTPNDIEPLARLTLGVSQVVARLRMQDRVGEGLTYATRQAQSFEVVRRGDSSSAGSIGRITLSFQTREPWGVYRDEDEGFPQMRSPDSSAGEFASWKRKQAVGLIA
mmetsp:Transcript_104640/g.293254  ORF Transcript_104640/g.293254 Transcript_104640/m.293254 type:complete len:224 (-) Transcript_104640:283-954(-)